MTTTPLRGLDEETWGERFVRAYMRARDRYDFSYETLANRVSEVYRFADANIQRLRLQTDVPSQQRTRLGAYYTLVAMGYDPADFGINEENTPMLRAMDRKKVIELLSPEGPAGPPAARTAYKGTKAAAARAASGPKRKSRAAASASVRGASRSVSAQSTWKGVTAGQRPDPVRRTRTKGASGAPGSDTQSAA